MESAVAGIETPRGLWHEADRHRIESIAVMEGKIFAKAPPYKSILFVLYT